jgi:hypothetical protein
MNALLESGPDSGLSHYYYYYYYHHHHHHHHYHNYHYYISKLQSYVWTIITILRIQGSLPEIPDGYKKNRRFKCSIVHELEITGNRTEHIEEGNIVTLSYRSNLVT